MDLAKILWRDPAELKRIAHGFAAILQESYKHDLSRPSIDESRRRFNIMLKWLRELRDKGWTNTRILDYMPRVLRMELDGETFVPDDRDSWVAHADPVLWTPERSRNGVL